MGAGCLSVAFIPMKDGYTQYKIKNADFQLCGPFCLDFGSRGMLLFICVHLVSLNRENRGNSRTPVRSSHQGSDFNQDDPL